MVKILSSFGGDRPTSTLEHAAFRYSEADRSVLQDVSQYSAGKRPFKLRGRTRDRNLDAFLLHNLKECLQSWNIACTTMPADRSGEPSTPFLRSRATFWEGMEYESSRLDAAEWTSIPISSIA